MPIHDFSVSPISNPQIEDSIAPAADRFLSFFLDFMIFSPLLSLVSAYWLKEVRTELLLDSLSMTAFSGVLIMGLMSFAFLCLLQTVCWVRFGATPGQKFLKLKVIALSGPSIGKNPTFTQALVRAITWNLSLLLLGLPFLEVLSHSSRRAFHDRGSDTMVVTTKKNVSTSPLPIEQRLVSSWMSMAFLMLILLGGFFTVEAFKAWRSDLQYESIRQAFDQNLICDEIPLEIVSSVDRLDTAAALYLANETSGACVGKEVDHVLWHQPQATPVQKSWAYFLKGLTITDQKQKIQYFSQSCGQGESLPSCQLAEWLQSQNKQVNNPAPDLEAYSVTAEVLKLETWLQKKDFPRSLAMLQRLTAVDGLYEFVQKKQVQWMWAYQADQQIHSQVHDRLPASEADSRTLKTNNETQSESADLKKAFGDFKKKFGVE